MPGESAAVGEVGVTLAGGQRGGIRGVGTRWERGSCRSCPVLQIGLHAPSPPPLRRYQKPGKVGREKTNRRGRPRMKLTEGRRRTVWKELL